ncbi:sugar-transfer associated ATP-grasp domain-containing protein [Salisediminibacterium halotolerans]|uniref:sugar-transfer associated ATP-grasp domain-containing protein n=1 Tax=Salisediminibacterium halotolerans TaxID=517425 RepID=UPI000F181305|nr:sugar-transfer associated ATP-grasp domain-containing protein [Salisediminibacterium halotolerans]RLJ75530.1 putative polysaccharide biosynthesis protein [Actinophytocola xinjiangensis]RPE89383.1 putative polysaccharide biosynthesis protein [Salisediminibacterium halotolerans]TWG36143.1 putative polysaccharide biosynthesis protein [Salisediminibacterium halotolerans]GEL07621.1 hypothetical protein SHA02_10370 [Salisediminibacterium halotolerans]
MTSLEALEIKLIDRSTDALDQSIEALDAKEYHSAITLYNTVLKAFEALKKSTVTADPVYKLLPEKIEQLQNEHENAVKLFEDSSWEELNEVLTKSVRTKFQDLRYYLRYRDYHEKLGMNIYSKYFENFRKHHYLETCHADSLSEVRNYWEEHYYKNVDTVLPTAFYSLTGNYEPRIIPQEQMRFEIIPFLNDKNQLGMYKDKNMYDRLIPSDRTANTILKRVNGQYFDGRNIFLTRSEAANRIMRQQMDLIVKASQSDDGKGIAKIVYRSGQYLLGKNKVNLKNIESIWGENYLIQTVIQQHEIMSAPHPHSLNTLRMVTLRWKGEIHHLLTYSRFGKDKSIQDNGGKGGISAGVTEEGFFKNFAIDKEANFYKKHPTTGYSFEENNVQVPNYEEFKLFVTELHEYILHHNFITWDIAVSPQGYPVFLEMNFWGANWLQQMVTEKPIFGELTEEILSAVSETKKYEKDS